MSAIEKFPPALMIEAIEKAHGKISLAAKSLKCSRQTIMNYAKEYADVREAIADARELMLDTAEDKLYKAITKGQPWAICFYLKTQGKERGYVERFEQKTIDWQSELVDLYRDGKVTEDQIRAELGGDLASDFFSKVGAPKVMVSDDDVDT